MKRDHDRGITDGQWDVAVGLFLVGVIIGLGLVIAWWVGR